MNFISPYSKLLKHFTYAHFLLIEGYKNCALRKEPVISLFAERFKQLLGEIVTAKFQ